MGVGLLVGLSGCQTTPSVSWDHAGPVHPYLILNAPHVEGGYQLAERGDWPSTPVEPPDGLRQRTLLFIDRVDTLHHRGFTPFNTDYTIREYSEYQDDTTYR